VKVKLWREEYVQTEYATTKKAGTPVSVESVAIYLLEFFNTPRHNLALRLAPQVIFSPTAVDSLLHKPGQRYCRCAGWCATGIGCMPSNHSRRVAGP